MLFIIFGDNYQKVLDRKNGLIKTLLQKRPEALSVSCDPESLNREKLEELAGGQGLFEKKSIITISRAFSKVDSKEAILETVSKLVSTENAFVMVEEKIDSISQKKLMKAGAKIEEFSFGGEKMDGSAFILADSLGKRDKKHTWVHLRKLLADDKSAEELHGILFWQIKCLLLAKKSLNAGASGLKPFVYNKSLNYSKNYTEEELVNISAKLADAYHNSRRGLFNLEDELERVVLDI